MTNFEFTNAIIEDWTGDLQALKEESDVVLRHIASAISTALFIYFVIETR